MNSWFYSTEYRFPHGAGERILRISGIVQADGVVAAYKHAQFRVEQELIADGNKPRREVTFTAFNKV